MNDIKKLLFETYINIDTSEQKVSYSMFELSCNANVSIIKPSEDDKGYIIRLFNPNKNTEKCSLKFNIDAKNVFIVNLSEEKQQELSVSDNQIMLDIPHDKIETIYLEV